LENLLNLLHNGNVCLPLPQHLHWGFDDSGGAALTKDDCGVFSDFQRVPFSWLGWLEERDDDWTGFGT